MKIPDDIIEILEDDTNLKMLGTADSNTLNINLEVVKTVKLIGEDTIIIPSFNNDNHTLSNIKKNRYISLAVFRPPVIGFKLNGFLKNIDTTDTEKYLKKFSTKPFYEAIADVVIIKITEIYALSMAISGNKII